MVTGIEPTTSSFLGQRRSRSDNQAPLSALGRYGTKKKIVGIVTFLEIEVEPIQFFN